MGYEYHRFQKVAVAGTVAGAVAVAEAVAVAVLRDRS